jgi:hypothetical protein
MSSYDHLIEISRERVRNDRFDRLCAIGLAIISLIVLAADIYITLQTGIHVSSVVIALGSLAGIVFGSIGTVRAHRALESSKADLDSDRTTFGQSYLTYIDHRFII